MKTCINLKDKFTWLYSAENAFEAFEVVFESSVDGACSCEAVIAVDANRIISKSLWP